MSRHTWPPACNRKSGKVTGEEAKRKYRPSPEEAAQDTVWATRLRATRERRESEAATVVANRGIKRFWMAELPEEMRASGN